MDRAKLYFIGGLLFTAVLGILSHFFYDWSGRTPLAALISPVNESIWEHMKLLFFPALLWSLFTPRSLRKDLPSLRPSLHSAILFFVFTFLPPDAGLFYSVSAQ